MRAQRQGRPGVPGSRFVYASPIAAPEAARQAAVVVGFTLAPFGRASALSKTAPALAPQMERLL